ncbi:hypothetical protein E9993_09445 [Labilibacter sediminis]|nr:hypothetical protein E9993_09445 [Labilibacter sediminis]
MKLLKPLIIILFFGGLSSACIFNKKEMSSTGSSNLTFKDLSESDQKLLDEIQRKAFDFFWDGYHPVTGLIGDAADPESLRGSIASVGFGLSAYCIGEKRGWVSHEEVYQRVLTILNSFYCDPNDKFDFCVEGKNGLFYHFINTATGARHGKCEVSTIDSAILMAGVLHVMTHFKGTEIEELAQKVYNNAQWDWYTLENGAIAGGWKPEKGIEGEYKGYNEYSLVYLVAMGSPTHPMPKQSWDAYSSGFGYEYMKSYDHIGKFLTPHGIFQPLAYLYQFPACWIDFRNKQDAYVNHWEVAQNALLANREYCVNWGNEFGVSSELWGWTACVGKDGYQGFMQPYNGTLAPSAVVASLPFIPKESMPTIRYMYDNYKDKIWGKYGFVDSFNPIQNWYDDGFLGIDQGNTVLMIENFRTGYVWEECMQNPIIQKGMEIAQFKEL